MDGKKNGIVWYAMAALVAVACGGSEFSGAADVAPEGGEGPIAGADQVSGRDPGGSGGKGSGGSTSIPDSGEDSGGSAGSAGSSPLGGSGQSTSGSGGAITGGSGSGESGSSGGSVPGTSGTGGLGGTDYRCSIPGTVGVQAMAACMKSLCSDLEYECGHVEDKCSGEKTPCGYESGAFPDCSKFAELKSCPSYEDCDLPTHKCEDKCERVRTGDQCGVSGQDWTFRYSCDGSANPGTCYPEVPGNPNSPLVCDCVARTAEGGGWCCSKNDSACTVRFVGELDDQGCDGRVYVYDCPSGLIPSAPSCAVAPSQGPVAFCCDTPGIE